MRRHTTLKETVTTCIVLVTEFWSWMGLRPVSSWQAYQWSSGHKLVSINIFILIILHIQSFCHTAAAAKHSKYQDTSKWSTQLMYRVNIIKNLQHVFIIIIVSSGHIPDNWMTDMPGSNSKPTFLIRSLKPKATNTSRWVEFLLLAHESLKYACTHTHTHTDWQTFLVTLDVFTGQLWPMHTAICRYLNPQPPLGHTGMPLVVTYNWAAYTWPQKMYGRNQAYKVNWSCLCMPNNSGIHRWCV